MRAVWLFLFLMTGILPATGVLAVTVDIWQTGMTRQQVWDLARQKDVAIAPVGRLHAARSFQERFLDPDARVFYCTGRYLNHDGTIYLRLVDAPSGDPVVRSIEVRFPQGFNSAVSERIVRTLTQEYGRARTTISSWQRLAEWRTDALDIRLEVRKDRSRLVYTDLTIQPEN
ncbi:MAG: hypothetical protein D6751_04225 [Deltaproteobacteria bacterium]|nr:MAG: hypothetical protein D6751_04225 [Deltaproteobacteria bacterium]